MLGFCLAQALSTEDENMIKFGIHNSYASTDWYADYDVLIKDVSSLGFDALECNPGTFLEMTKQKREGIKQLAEDRGLDLIFSFGLPKKYDLSSEDESIRQNGISYMKDILNVVHEMGSDLITGCIYSYWPYNYATGTRDREKLQEISVKSLKELTKVAEDLEIDYAMEILNRFEQIVLNTAQEAVDFVKRIDSPRAKIALDTFHMNIEEDSISGALRTAKDYLIDVHLGERNRKFPGMGDFDWTGFMKTIRDINYNKYLVFEPFMITGGEVGENVYLWRDLTGKASKDQLNQMARDSLDFLKAML
jgi:D-psicose/D-tagatose/L-ribulose 3-epimerase